MIFLSVEKSVIPTSLKELYFLTMSGPMRLSGSFYRIYFAPRSGNAKVVRVQLGPGQEGYKPGWINVDANCISARVDVWADLRNKLPFRDNSIDVFYSHHVIEHLPDRKLAFHFQEMHRCLKTGGVIRVGGPNADEAFRNFLAQNSDWFDQYGDGTHGSLGGKLVNFLLCQGEHRTLLSRSYLAEILEAAGFAKIMFRAPISDTGYPNLLSDAIAAEWELTPAAPHTLMVEAVKAD